jgi:DNA-binding NarL/FixJ family response regulator
MCAEKARIILVEDHKLIRAFLRKFIDRIGCCQIVAEAVCGTDALDVIRSAPADLIVIDLSLPGRSGVEVIRETKRISTAKILVFTMITDAYHIQEAIDSGADGICLKDRSAETLGKAIKEILEGKHPIYLEKEVL